MRSPRPWLAATLTAAVWLLTSAAAALALIPPALEAPAPFTGPETRVWDFEFVDLEQRQCFQQFSRGPPSVTREHTYFVGQHGVWVHNDCKKELRARVEANIAASRKARVARNVAKSRNARRTSNFSEHARRDREISESPTDNLVGGGAKRENLSGPQQELIQDFANRNNVKVTVVGSRAAKPGGNGPESDFDFIIEPLNSKIKKRAKRSLPRGQGGGGIGPRGPTGRDFLAGPVNTDKPFISFIPEGSK